MNDLVKQDGFDLAPSNMKEAFDIAEWLSQCDLVPKHYRGKPYNILAATQMGREVGMPTMMALQSIAVINGTPCIWGKAIPALIKSHPKYEWMNEDYDEKTQTAICTIKRKGEPEQTQTFSKSDAEKAGLLNRDTYKQHLKRMLQMRARSRCASDVFPDALMGLVGREEAEAYPEEKDITPPPSSHMQEQIKALKQLEKLAEDQEKPKYTLEQFETDLYAVTNQAQFDIVKSKINELPKDDHESAGVILRKYIDGKKKAVNNA